MAGCVAIACRSRWRSPASGRRASSQCQGRIATHLRSSRPGFRVRQGIPPNMKKVTLTVDVVVEIEDDVEPNDVTFDIDLEKIRPMICNKYVGRALGYCTQEYV